MFRVPIKKKKNLLRTKLPWKTAVRQHTGSLTLLSGDTAVRQLLASGTDAGTLCRLTRNNYVWRIRKVSPPFLWVTWHIKGDICANCWKNEIVMQVNSLSEQPVLASQSE